MKQIYEGKAKIVYEGNPGEVVLYYKDDTTAGNGAKRESLPGKGILNNQISTILFDYLASHGVRTHLIEQVDERTCRCTRTQVIPLEVIVRNVAAGSIVRRLGFERGASFSTPIVEFSYKNDALGDPLLNDDHIQALHAASTSELAHIRSEALCINSLLIERFARIGLTLVDFKLEFGRTHDKQILLVDEISGDNCRLWDAHLTSFDKDLFREDSGDLIASYTTLYELLKGSM